MSESSAPAMTSQRPYLLRALYEWVVDNGMTPHVLVNARMPGVRVPAHTIKDGQVVLNIADRAVAKLTMDNDALRFSARFGGVSQNVVIPMAAVIAIYARESGQGMALPEELPAGTPSADAETDTTPETAQPQPADDGPPEEAPEPPKRGGHLRIVK
ncbi:ClpXP protease specificity-enhancing factor [Thermomonas sp.]|uniref:ClpXP protease specificity-enhancing factor n=1 Tax=Thermomonas sp. TaxID=1971895 RepID=UPI001DBBB8A4|nr:ClpXP protease specificity-enhancing factor [Thermomonas sp.]MBZ0088081.1 ClpXP protease specificity-enhancing factor [Thermomonas sp.]HRO63496.1 ClpXP protease specificity-enhancing factor [Thermomonas sp.]